MALKRYDLVKADHGWELMNGGKVVGWFESKKAALEPNGVMQKLLDTECTLRIHTEKGGIEEERTYPRSKDPRKSPG